MPLGQVPAQQAPPSGALAPAFGLTAALAVLRVVDARGEAAGHTRILRRSGSERDGAGAFKRECEPREDAEVGVQFGLISFVPVASAAAADNNIRF